MAFWGFELKPGRPFIHPPLNARLHLSQATLGMGRATQKSIVQCNVGNKSPVFLCCLFPDKAECCQLNLEFEETDEVVFSVIGPRSVHLTGFYLSNSSHNHLKNDDSESYGEDIAETETERSENSEESEYGGSFINDDDPQTIPSSPDCSDSNEARFDLRKPKHGEGTHRRLRKKYQLSESESDDSSQQKVASSAVAAVDIMDSDIEDSLPISSLCMGQHAANSGNINVEEKARKETDNLNGNETEDNLTMIEGTSAAIHVQHESESGLRDEEKQKHMPGVAYGMPKKKREGLAEEERFPEADNGIIGEVVLEQNQKLASNEEGNLQHNHYVASTQVNLEDGAKLQRKRNIHVREKILKDNVAKEDECQKNGSSLDVIIQDVHANKETEKKRKRKKRCKNKEDEDATKLDIPLLSGTGKKISVVDMEGKNANEKEIQLSNGITVEELVIGKPDGKVASVGKKVRVRYTGKLKGSGQVFDSSAGKAPLKFRLGGEEVSDIWNVGLDGMRVGGKRRVTVPPSVSFRNGGDSENIPPSSWLVFDVELVKVR